MWIVIVLGSLLLSEIEAYGNRNDCQTVSVGEWKRKVAMGDTLLTIVHGHAIPTHTYCIDFEQGGQKVVRLNWRFAGVLAGHDTTDWEVFTNFSLRDLKRIQEQYQETTMRPLYMPRTDVFLKTDEYTKGPDRVSFCLQNWPVMLHPDQEKVEAGWEMRAYLNSYNGPPADSSTSAFYDSIKSRLNCEYPWVTLGKAPPP